MLAQLLEAQYGGFLTNVSLNMRDDSTTPRLCVTLVQSV